jgi:hypothetical protein
MGQHKNPVLPGTLKSMASTMTPQEETYGRVTNLHSTTAWVIFQAKA